MARSAGGNRLAEGMSSAKKPIQIKPSRVGSLHRALGVPQGQKIPASKIAAAAKSSNPNLRKKANFAKNAASWG
jgi:hypothetical protein